MSKYWETLTRVSEILRDSQYLVTQYLVSVFSLSVFSHSVFSHSRLSVRISTHTAELHSRISMCLTPPPAQYAATSTATYIIALHAVHYLTHCTVTHSDIRVSRSSSSPVWHYIYHITTHIRLLHTSYCYTHCTTTHSDFYVSPSSSSPVVHYNMHCITMGWIRLVGSWKL